MKGEELEDEREKRKEINHYINIIIAADDLSFFLSFSLFYENSNCHEFIHSKKLCVHMLIFFCVTTF